MSIDPETSHITTSLVFFCLRRLNESLMNSPPFLKDWRRVRRKSTLKPRLTVSQRRLGLRESRLAILRASREISSSSSALNRLKSFSASDSTLLAPGKLIGSVALSRAAPQCSRKKASPLCPCLREESRTYVESSSLSTIFRGCGLRPSRFQKPSKSSSKTGKSSRREARTLLKLKNVSCLSSRSIRLSAVTASIASEGVANRPRSLSALQNKTVLLRRSSSIDG